MPEIVTAGGATVGVRVPAHPVALALLNAAGVPIAAPSANRSSQISPTTAEHVLGDLNGRVDLILDAGPTPGGLESTVLDVTTNPPRLLRPGLVTIGQLHAVIGAIDTGKYSQRYGSASEPGDTPLRSPGLLARHYAPRAKIILVERDLAAASIKELSSQEARVAWLRLPAHPNPLPTEEGVLIIEMPFDAASYSARLYAALHEADDAGASVIVVDLPPEGDAWRAVHDRLRRGAAPG